MESAIPVNSELSKPRISAREWAVMAVCSLALIALTTQGWLRGDEVFGFITGGACVWLVVRQHVLNWPIGLVNNIVFFVLFFNSRLYADMGLQVVFFALGVYGWWNWVRFGPDSQPLKPTHANRGEWVGITIFLIGGTALLREILIEVNGSAPFWDAFTTVLSLVAQFLLCRKRIENWCFWISADAIYVPLYISRDLPLTGVLYGIFLVLCIIGLVFWRRSLRERPR